MPNAGTAVYFVLSAHDAPRVMKKSSTKTKAEPSKASLKEMPEIDFATARVLGRGRRVEKARRSLETILVDKKVLKTLGGAEALIGLLEALAKSIEASRKKHRAA